MFVDDETLEEVVEGNGQNKESHKHKRKRSKNKANKNRQQAREQTGPVGAANSGGETTDRERTDEESQEAIEIELVPETIELDKNYEEFARVFEHFKVSWAHWLVRLVALVALVGCWLWWLWCQ